MGIKVLLFDFSRVILNVKDESYTGSLNKLHDQLYGNADYNFFDHYQLNTGLLDYLKQYKDKYKLVIFTTGTIQNTPEIAGTVRDVFSKIYTVHEVGLAKETKESYEYICKDLSALPEEVVFVDDQAVNVAAAREAGLHGIQYLDNGQIIEKLNEILNS